MNTLELIRDYEGRIEAAKKYGDFILAQALEANLLEILSRLNLNFNEVGIMMTPEKDDEDEK